MTTTRDAAKEGREVQAVEVTQAYLDAIERREPQIRAFNEVLADRAMQQARGLDARRRAGEGDLSPQQGTIGRDGHEALPVVSP